jgi:hypothetical protein
MEATRGGGPSGGRGSSREADLLERLNLTQEEVEFAAFSDDEVVVEEEEMEFALIGKVLSPSALHISTITVGCRINTRTKGTHVWCCPNTAFVYVLLSLYWPDYKGDLIPNLNYL